MSNTILLVDRSQTSRSFFKSLLRGRKGCRVLAACGGLEALELLGSSPVNLVILNLELIRLDDIELIHEMARRFPRTAVVLFTNSGDEALLVQSIRAGAAAFSPRSIQAGQHGAVIERVLSRSLAGQELNDDRFEKLEELSTVGSDPAVVSGFVDRLNELMVRADFGGLGSRICFCEFLQELLHYLLADGERQLLDRANQAMLSKPRNRRAARSSNYYGQSRRLPRTAELFVTIHLSSDQLSLTLCPKGQGFNLPSLPAERSAESPESRESPWLGLIDALLDDFGFDRSGRVLCLLKYRTNPLAIAQLPEKPGVSAPHQPA